MSSVSAALQALVAGDCVDPFAVLGPHETHSHWIVRTFLPHAESVELLDVQNRRIAALSRVHSDGLFEARLPLPREPYRFRVQAGGHTRVCEDPFRFPSPLGELDRHLMKEGTHLQLYAKLGAHPMTLDGVAGVHFVVWAPNARRVSVVGPFNQWDGRCHVMRLHHENGVWDLFVPGLGEGTLYKFEIKAASGRILPLKADPFARWMEPPPGNASIVYRDRYSWQDQTWMAGRGSRSALQSPLAIYEVHLGSWRRHRAGDRWLTYLELADELVAYVKDMGYTHVEFLPVSEHPFDGSWGYQPIGLFAPTWRFGKPEHFKHLVDRCHQAGIGVIVDWVPAHFPRDAHGLGFFDGTHLYEHADPRRGEHQDWGTLVFNYGRPEVSNYLLSSALFWLEEFHVDALRVDAVASMLYLDYSRRPGEWVPNKHGGNENLEAVVFLQRLNELVHEHGGVTMAEESTAWPQVSRPTYLGGLGFTFKWNMGWMHDTLDFMALDPVHRKYHQNKLTFGIHYAFSENFILPLSHDEVVHGKGSLIARMPGDAWRKFANLRLYYTFMYTHPGKKLLFMGGEFGQEREWNHAAALDWGLLKSQWHEGLRRLVRDLNSLYVATPALHEVDFEAAGFEWIDCSDAERSVLAFIRRAKAQRDFVVIVCNFTPVVRREYRVGVPSSGRYLEILNSDGAPYGGSGVGNLGAVSSEQVAWHGQAHSLKLSLPPLAALVLKPETTASTTRDSLAQPTGD